MSFLSQLDWRFATKQFDPSKKLSEQDVEKILTAIRMAPTSFGLQPFHVFNVEDPALRQAIRAVAYDQAQVTEASHLLVFCARNDMEEWIEEYIKTASQGNEEVGKGLESLRGVLRGSILSRSPEGIMIWAARQSYIALGFGLAACAELAVDSCPMEGFNNAEVDAILGLPAHMRSQAFLALGYRASDARYPRVRFPKEKIFTTR